MGFLNVFNQIVHAMVIEPHAVDQAFRLNHAEQARLVVARLRAWRHGADFHMAEAHRAERIDAFAVFIQTGGQSQRVFERQPHAADRFGRHGLTDKKR
ncbi:Uncharacterised protein [Serratia marcescens]|nr:Uncharacterised protein [Serratia marcescens]